MKALILAVLMAATITPAFAGITPQQRLVEAENFNVRFQAWRNNTHHNLVYCSMFYAISAKYMEEKFPAVGKKSADLSGLSMDYALALEMPQAVTVARMKMFSDDFSTYAVEGGYSILFQEYGKKCQYLMNNVGAEMQKFTDEIEALKKK